MPNWYFSKEGLLRTPSRLDGIDHLTEIRYRREGTRFIMNCGNKMGLYPSRCLYFYRLGEEGVALLFCYRMISVSLINFIEIRSLTLSGTAITKIAFRTCQPYTVHRRIFTFRWSVFLVDFPSDLAVMEEGCLVNYYTSREWCVVNMTFLWAVDLY